MGMPQIPDGKNRPNFQETIVDLLESVALEEMALAHMINAEGEKLQEVVKQFSYCGIDFGQMEQSCKTTHRMINAIIMKEWLLMNKLHMIMEVSQTIDKPKPPYLSPCSREQQGDSHTQNNDSSSKDGKKTVVYRRKHKTVAQNDTWGVTATVPSCQATTEGTYLSQGWQKPAFADQQIASTFYAKQYKIQDNEGKQ